MKRGTQKTHPYNGEIGKGRRQRLKRGD